MSGKWRVMVWGSVGCCSMGVLLAAALFAQGQQDSGSPPALDETPKASAAAGHVSAAPVIRISAIGPVVESEPTPAPKPDKPGKKPRTGKKHAPSAALLASMARHLHSEAYRQFIKAPGFGSNREIALMTAKKRPWIMPKWTSEELTKMTAPVFWAGDLSLIHRLSVFQFAASNAPTGAKPAADGLPGKKTYQWDIKTLDLVGIAMHESPVVFISETVPQMKELKDKKTRPLDVFETEGVEELHNGKDLYIRSKDGTTRVLGPIRAGKACLKCHRDAKEGALLGAFSYTLRIGEYTLRGRRGQLDPYIRPGSQPLPKSN